MLIVKTEEECQQLTEIEKGEEVVLMISQKEIRCLIKGLGKIQLHDKKEKIDTYI